MNSIRGKKFEHIEGIRQFINDHPSYHIFGCAETWLDPVVADDVVELRGYCIIRQDRNVNGGGIALYVRSDLKVKILDKSDTLGPGRPGILEYLFCSV